jgi:ribosome maturation factor RimP
MIDRNKIWQLVSDRLSGTAIYPVDITVSDANLIVVEVDSDDPVGVDDCAALSRHIEANLDRDVEDYELEVGSCGLTAPFKVLRQYVKNMGNEVELVLKNGARLAGVLTSATVSGVTISVAKQVKPEGAKRKITVEEEHSFAFDDIKQAKYILKFK